MKMYVSLYLFLFCQKLLLVTLFVQTPPFLLLQDLTLNRTKPNKDSWGSLFNDARTTLDIIWRVTVFFQLFQGLMTQLKHFLDAVATIDEL